MPHPMIHRLLFAAWIPTLALLPLVQGAPAATATPAASVKVESAGDILPFTLQGFFGKPGAVEVSFRDKTSGATAWVKPGKSFSGWKVESVDTAKGAVILAASGRRVLLQKAREAPASEAFAAPKLKSKEESLVWRKFEALEKDPEVKKFFERADKEIDSRMKINHPEFYDEQGDIRSPEPTGYMAAMFSETKRLLREEKTPSVVNAIPVFESMMDGYLQAGPQPESPHGANQDELNRYHEQIDLHELKTYENADRIYRARYGKTELAPVTSLAADNESDSPED